ncbi:MFS transporter, partial [Halobacteriales archaeon QS_1_68_17]
SLPVVMADLSIGESAAATIITIPQIAATVVGIPLGVVLDRADSRRTVPAAAGVLFAAGLWSWQAGLSGSYLGLVLSRFLGGMPMIALWIAGTNAISSAFGPEWRATATSLFITGYPVGYALGQVTGPVIGDAFGWPATFPAYTFVLLCLGVVFAFVRRRVAFVDVASQPPRLADFRALLGNRGVWAICAASFLGYSLYMIFNSWLPSYLAGEIGISLAESGLVAALFPAVGIVSRPAGGWLSDAVFGRRRRPVLYLSFAGALVLGVAMGSLRTVALVVVGLALAGFFIQLPLGLLYQFVQEFVDQNVAGTAIGLVSVAGWLGSFVAPVVAGRLIAVSGAYATTFAFAVALAGAGLLAAWASDEPIGHP